MRVDACVGCRHFPCGDVNKQVYIVPGIEIQPEQVSIVMISEAAPENLADYYYAPDNPSFERTTVLAFQDAGVQVTSIEEILEMGVYLTTAVKCGKTGSTIHAETIKECSLILEQELALFPNVQAYLLMGDVAIRALNYIGQRVGTGRVVPAVSTYKLRDQKFYFRDAHVFPSYLQVGPSFNIEKSKRRMIAEDIAEAMRLR